MMKIILLAILIVLINTDTSLAYLGPGLGAGTIGVVVGIIVSFLLAIFAILFYPIKRLYKMIRKSKKSSAPVENKS